MITDIALCPGWTPVATVRYPSPDPRPCAVMARDNQSVLRRGQTICTRCKTRKTKWDNEAITYEDRRLLSERRSAMLLSRSVVRVVSVADITRPQTVIAALEQLLVPYQYDPDKDPLAQEQVATTSGKYPEASRLHDPERWRILRAVYGMGPER